MDATITFTSLGTSTGPFNLFADVNAYCCAFEIGVTRTQLLAGFTSHNVPAGTNNIKVVSAGVCNTNVIIPMVASTTTSTTTIFCNNFSYNATTMACGTCGDQRPITVNNDVPLVPTKYYHDSVGNSTVYIDSLISCNDSGGAPHTLDPSTQKNTCPEVTCNPVLTTTTTTLSCNNYVYDVTIYDCGICIFAGTDTISNDVPLVVQLL